MLVQGIETEILSSVGSGEVELLLALREEYVSVVGGTRTDHFGHLEVLRQLVDLRFVQGDRSSAAPSPFFTKKPWSG